MNRRERKRGGGQGSERVGQLVDGRYRLCRLIGKGGMSSVYEATIEGDDRRVAIKLLHPTLASDSDAVARLHREATILSAIKHPNICRIFGVGNTDQGSPYIVMERLCGETLARRIAKDGPFEFSDLATSLKQVLGALEAAHVKGVMHRDLKPENIFLVETRPGTKTIAKLLDFGISSYLDGGPEDRRLTRSGMVMGTPYYMAPEQARGDSSLDQRADLWALGVVMYEALTGQRPFVANNYNTLLIEILRARPKPLADYIPFVPEPLAALFNRALAKDSKERFQSARAFAIAVEQVEKLWGEQGITPPMWSSDAQRRASYDRGPLSEDTEVMVSRFREDGTEVMDDSRRGQLGTDLSETRDEE
ncbi:MAG: serine/threonine-protein kinase [Polyangiaceae bacterium]